jgi:branched-chain amino acid transport system substrate-binding protein
MPPPSGFGALVTSLRLVVCCLAGLLLVGCGGKKPSDPSAVKIGVIHSVSGGAANPRNMEAILMAVDEINANGGINGATLELEVRDDATNTDKAKEAAVQLAELKVPVVIGPINSTRFLAASETFVPAKISQLGGAATSPAVTTVVDDGYVFRTVTSDSGQGALVAKRAKAGGVSRMAVLYVNSVYGVGLANAFETAFVAGGGTVTSKVQIVDNQTSYTSMWSDIFAGDPDPQAIFLISVVKDGVTIMRDYNTGFLNQGAKFYFCDALAATTDFVLQVGTNAFTFPHEGFVAGAPQTTQYKAFKDGYKAKYGADPLGNTANFYDATYLAALALHASKGTDAVTVRDNLTKVSKSPGTLYGAGAYAAAIADLDAGKDIDYDGASGAVDFDANGDVVGGYGVSQVINGAFQVVEPFVLP